MGNEVATNFLPHDPNAIAVHLINSQLLSILFLENGGALRPLLVEPAAWIVNALYVHGPRFSFPHLKTSATICRETIYDHRTRADSFVYSIDEVVPLPTSVCGRCVLSNRPIWLGRNSFDDTSRGFGERYYRSFDLVDVRAAQVPELEVVFPISIHQLSASMAIGAINLEFFGSPAYDAEVLRTECPSENVNELMQKILRFHAGFLLAAINILDDQLFEDLEPAGVATAIETSGVVQFVTAYSNLLRSHIRNHDELIKGVREQLTSAVEKARTTQGDSHAD